MFGIILFLVVFSTANGISLDCDFNTWNWISLPKTFKHTYTCKAKGFLESTNGTVSDVTGKHLPGKNNFDVEFVKINNHELTFIPRGLTRFFPNMFALYLHNSNIKVLHGFELDEYPRLIYFAYESGTLDTIGGELFTKTPKIIYANFYNNKIRNVGWNLLDNVKSTAKVIFGSNICINKDSRNNPHHFNELVQILRENCTSFPPEVTTPIDDECFEGNLEQKICELMNQNRRLERKLEDLIEYNKRIENKLENFCSN